MRFSNTISYANRSIHCVNTSSNFLKPKSTNKNKIVELIKISKNLGLAKKDAMNCGFGKQNSSISKNYCTKRISFAKNWLWDQQEFHGMVKCKINFDTLKTKINADNYIGFL